MSKTILVNAIAEKTGLTKAKADEVFNAFIESSQETLETEKKLALPGIGNFTVVHKEARTGRNPQTGESMQIAAKNVVNFKMGKVLKERVNED